MRSYTFDADEMSDPHGEERGEAARPRTMQASPIEPRGRLRRTSSLYRSRLPRPIPISLAFTFLCDLLQIESKIAETNWRSPGKRSLDRVFDLAIIGGGINGCGIARDAAGRGNSVFLCEMNTELPRPHRIGAMPQPLIPPPMMARSKPCPTNVSPAIASSFSAILLSIWSKSQRKVKASEIGRGSRLR